MVYRHIYWGLLCIGPDEDNLLTEAVKPKSYLIKIVTPVHYATKEEAEKDDMEYYFQVSNRGTVIKGVPGSFFRHEKESGMVPEECPRRDEIRQEDWTRYRIIRLKENPIAAGSHLAINGGGGKPCSKRWNKIFPVADIYPIKKVAYSVIAVPDVKAEGGKECRYR